MAPFAEEFDDLAEIGTRPVSHVVDDAAQLTPRIELLPASGHTAGDVMALVADCDVLFAGDLCFFGVTPLAFQGDPATWADVLDAVADLADVIVPGHGPVGGAGRGPGPAGLPALLRRGLDPARALGRLARPGRGRRDQHREGRHAARRRHRHAPHHAQSHRPLKAPRPAIRSFRFAIASLWRRDRRTESGWCRATDAGWSTMSRPPETGARPTRRARSRRSRTSSRRRSSNPS